MKPNKQPVYTVLGRGEVACWHKTDVPIHFQQCPLVAQSGHPDRADPCPLLGVKRTHADVAQTPPFNQVSSVSSDRATRRSRASMAHFAAWASRLIT